MTQSSDFPGSRRFDPSTPRYQEGAYEPSTTGGQQSSTDVAKDQAGAVAGTASDAGKHVAGVAGEQAGQVASEASQQVRDLVHQTRGELTEQAATQQKRVAGGLRSLGEELHSMAQNSEQKGPATDLVKQAAERTGKVASWLEDREHRAMWWMRSPASPGSARARSWPSPPVRGFWSGASAAV